MHQRENNIQENNLSDLREKLEEKRIRIYGYKNTNLMNTADTYRLLKGKDVCIGEYYFNDKNSFLIKRTLSDSYLLDYSSSNFLDFLKSEIRASTAAWLEKDSLNLVLKKPFIPYNEYSIKIDRISKRINFNQTDFENSEKTEAGLFHSLLHAKAYYTVLYQKPVKRPFIISAGSSPGSQQYSAKWLDNIESNWHGLKSALIRTMASNVKL